jgi:hypothetical protein
MIDLIDTRALLIVGFTALLLAGLIGVLSAVMLARRFPREPAIERSRCALGRMR